MYLATADTHVEDPRAQAQRRMQQRKCLVCGARSLVNHQTSYFCATHIRAYRYCCECQTLRTAADHGQHSRCRSCNRAHALASYYANTDKTIYRIRLQQMATRTATRGELIFHSLRRRIAPAALVKATPAMSWPARARLFGGNPTHLAQSYRRQCAGLVRDSDATDRARDRYWRTK